MLRADQEDRRDLLAEIAENSLTLELFGRLRASGGVARNAIDLGQQV